MTELIAQFHFIRPFWLLALIPLWFMRIKMRQCRLQQTSWRTICDPLLLKALLVGNPTKEPQLPFILLFTGWIITIIILAGPTWSKAESAGFRDEQARVIIVDLSASMLTEDVVPNRMTRAKHKITDILNLPYAGETALIAYAKHAFVVTPLTQDNNTIMSLLPSLNPSIMPAQGSRPKQAFRKALALLQSVNAQQGTIIWITDNIPSAMKNTARAIQKAGYDLAVLGIGSQQTKQQHDKTITALDSFALRRFAIEGNGVYSNITTDDSDIDYLLSNNKSTTVTKSPEKQTRWADQGPILMLLLTPLLLLSFRRGWFGLILLGFLPLPSFHTNAEAFELNALWLNKDQQGAVALSSEKYEKAANLYAHTTWKGVAWYLSENYDKAIDNFKTIDSTLAHYNMANALAKQGHLRLAIEAYQQVLAQEPEHSDAQYNKKLLENWLQKNPHYQPPKSSSSTEQDQQSGAGDAPSSQQSQSDQAENQGEQSEQNTPDSSQETLRKIKKQSPTGQPKPKPLADQWLHHIPDDPGSLLKQKFLSEAKKSGLSLQDDPQAW